MKRKENFSKNFLFLLFVAVSFCNKIYGMLETVESSGYGKKTNISKIENCFGQSFYFFKTNAPDPYLIECSPLKGELINVSFGTQKEDGSSNHIKKNEEFQNLIPLRHTKYYVDSGVKEDIKYPGYWGNKIPGNLIENALYNTEMLPRRNYPENFFVKEYKKGLPGVMLFENQDQLLYFCLYLKKVFDLNEVVLLEEKPVILLEIIDGSIENLPEEISVFLKTFFTVVSKDDLEIQKIFNKFHENYYDIKNMTKDADTVGESIFEKLLNTFEKDGHKFDYKLMIFWIATLSVPFLLKPIKESCEGIVDDNSDKIRIGLSASAAIFFSWITKNILQKKGSKKFQKGLFKKSYTKTEIASISAGTIATLGSIYLAYKALVFKRNVSKNVDVSTQTAEEN